MLRRILDIDLACPLCGMDLAVVSFMAEPETIDRILAHMREEGTDLPFDARAPPEA